MSDQDIALSSLAMDLKRVSLGIYNKSETVANRFLSEALKRKKEIDPKKVEPYIAQILSKIRPSLSMNFAEDALMYSTILQNYIVSKRKDK